MGVLLVELHEGAAQLDALLEALGDFLLDEEHVLVVLLQVLEAAALGDAELGLAGAGLGALVLELVDLGAQLGDDVLVLGDVHLHQLLVLGDLALDVLGARVRDKGALTGWRT